MGTDHDLYCNCRICAKSDPVNKDLRISELTAEVERLNKYIVELLERNDNHIRRNGELENEDHQHKVEICSVREKNSELLAVIAEKDKAIGNLIKSIDEDEEGEGRYDVGYLKRLRESLSLPLDRTALDELKAGYEATIKMAKQKVEDSINSKSQNDLAEAMAILEYPTLALDSYKKKVEDDTAGRIAEYMKNLDGLPTGFDVAEAIRRGEWRGK